MPPSPIRMFFAPEAHHRGRGACRVQEREGVRARAQCRHPESALRLEVGRPGETSDVGGARSGDRSLLVSATRAHFDQCAALCCADHPSRRRSDRRVVVQNRQCEGFQDDALAERAVDGQHGGAGEVELTFGVPVHVPAEPVIGEVCERLAIAEVRKRRQCRLVERELRQRFHESGGSGDHAVAAAFGKPAGEHLERRPPVRGPVVQRSREHRQLVLVGE